VETPFSVCRVDGENAGEWWVEWFFTNLLDMGTEWKSVADLDILGPGLQGWSCVREVMPSFRKTFFKCHSTVRALMKSRAAISGFVRP